MTQLNQNTISLQEILAAVNNLPEAGGGGSSAPETCQVTVTSNGRAQISYASELTEAGKHRAETFTGTRTLTVIKNTTIFFSTGFIDFVDPWISNLCFTNGDSTLAFVTQDCSVTLND